MNWFDQTVIWYPCFHSEPRWWAQRFHHVSLSGFSEGRWIHLDLARQQLHFAVIEDPIPYLETILHNYTVLKFGRSLKGTSFFRPMTCVSFVQHVIGVRSGALLPDGLFRILTREYGAEIVNDPEQDPGTHT